MQKYIIRLFVFFLLFVFSCDSVSDLFNPKNPRISDNGLMVSADRISPLDTVNAWISATNPIAGPMYYHWSVNGGRYLEPANKDTVRWAAPIKGGLYELKVVVSNDKASAPEAKRQVNVISSEAPVVDIREPPADSYFVLAQQVRVKAHAEHENGISSVSFFVQDSLISKQDGNNSGDYYFTLTLQPAMVGQTTLTVQARSVNQNAPAGSDQVTIKVGGIIPGKNGN